MSDKQSSPSRLDLNKIFRWPLLFPGNPMQIIPELEEIPMAPPVHRPLNMRWYGMAITVLSVLFILLVGLALYLWLDSYLPLVIAAILVAGLLLVLGVTYLMRLRTRDNLLTVSKRYAITWWDRIEDEEWTKKQLLNIIYTVLFVALGVFLFTILFRTSILPLLRSVTRGPIDLLLLGVGMLVIVVFVIGAVLLVRQLVAEPGGTEWRWISVAIVLLFLLLGIWLFYSGHFPDWASRSGRSRSGPAPLVVLGTIGLFGMITWLSVRRFETARAWLVFATVAFWFAGLFELVGPGPSVSVGTVIPALVLFILCVYVVIRILKEIIDALRAFFRAAIQFLAAFVGIVPKIGRKLWRLIVDSRFWRRADVWIDLQGQRLRILGIYAQEWTDTFLRWVNDAISVEDARAEWANIKLNRETKWHEAHEEYVNRLRQIDDECGRSH